MIFFFRSGPCISVLCLLLLVACYLVGVHSKCISFECERSIMIYNIMQLCRNTDLYQSLEMFVRVCDAVHWPSAVMVVVRHICIVQRLPWSFYIRVYIYFLHESVFAKVYNYKAKERWRLSKNLYCMYKVLLIFRLKIVWIWIILWHGIKLSYWNCFLQTMKFVFLKSNKMMTLFIISVWLFITVKYCHVIPKIRIKTNEEWPAKILKI